MGLTYTYLDLSVLPSEAPLFVLRSPPGTLRVVAWLTTALSAFFWSIALFVPFAMWRETPETYHLDLRHCFLWIAFLLSFIGIGCCLAGPFMIVHFLLTGVTNSLAIYFYFETVRQNFNTIITRPGAPDLGLIASHGKCFKCESQSILISWNKAHPTRVSGNFGLCNGRSSFPRHAVRTMHNS